MEAEGGTGIGHAYTFAPNQAESIRVLIEDLAETLIGQELTDVRRIWHDLWIRINFIGQSGPPVMALAAIDTALWDLLAQQARLPLYRLLGAHRDRLPVYASGGWLSYSAGELVEDALRFREAGYRHYKIKVGSPDWRQDLERVRAIRKAVGDDLVLMVDANQGWDEATAIQAGRALEQEGVSWFEEPVPVQDLSGSARIAAALEVPVATGETVFTRHGFLPLIEARAGDVLMPDLMRCGGPTEYMQVVALADAYQLPVSSHTFTEVSAHLMAAAPNCMLVEYIPGWWDDLFEGAPEIHDGFVHLPDRPGLGFRFAPDAMVRHNRA
jgi:mandelate racemase